MLYAVVMAGGIGERFWPLSTPRRPKQLIPFFDDEPLLSRAVERLDPLLPIDRIILVTTRELEVPIRDLIPSIPPENLILEPVGKNTAPAAALATQKILRRDPDGVIAMFPSDHMIEGKKVLHDQLLQAVRIAESRYLVTFGIQPNHPATGYGYIRLGGPLKARGAKGSKVFRAEAFVEKPDRERAEAYLRDGGYLWNSGIFVWSGKFFLEQVRAHAPALSRSLMDIREAIETPDEPAAIDRFYRSVEKISVDYAIMERSDRVAVIPADFQWDDLGSWTALERTHRADEEGNVIVGRAILDDVRDCIVYVEDGAVALLGLRDLVVVRVGEVTMVCHRSKAETVRKLAEKWRDVSKGEGKKSAS